MTEPQRAILIVEDEAEILEVIASSLKRRQYRVTTAATFGDAQRALAEAGGPVVDIILTDVRLPDGDGLDLVRQMCGKEAPRPRMIVMTGHLDRQSVDGALTSGAEAVLLKPFKLNTLIDRINNPGDESQGPTLTVPGT